MSKTWKEIRKFFVKEGKNIKLPPAGKPKGEYDRKNEKEMVKEALKEVNKGGK